MWNKTKTVMVWMMTRNQKKSKAKKMTDTGKPVTPIETSPKMPKTKNEKNKV